MAIARLFVTGSCLLDDRELVFNKLNQFMFNENDVILLASVLKGKEYSRVPYEFPLAVEWLKKMWYKSSDPKKQRYSIVQEVYAPREKMRVVKGNEVWFSPKHIKNLLEQCTHLVVFWDVGNVALRDKYIWKLSKSYPVKRLRVLI